MGPEYAKIGKHLVAPLDVLKDYGSLIQHPEKAL